MALWCSAGSTGFAGAPQTSPTVSAVWASKRGNSAPMMGYFRTSSVRRSTTARSAAATPSRNGCSPPKSGRHAVAATAATAAASGKAARKHFRCGGRRSAVTKRSIASRCSAPSSVIRASRLRQSAPAPPCACMAEAHVDNCCLIMPHCPGGGLLSVRLLERMDTRAAAPEARGAQQAGDWPSSASSCAGAANGSKSLASKRSSLASEQDSSWSSHLSLQSGLPSRDHARQRHWALSAPRRAWVIRRRRHSSLNLSPSCASLAGSQPSASKPAAAIA
mmetsp:Transcript_145095/g.404248  ORF Transcript_145095/g.404248 Transcript_145095/m.404248 type:complete len:277 (+) Transcript_145095:1242-2072(+)